MFSADTKTQAGNNIVRDDKTANEIQQKIDVSRVLFDGPTILHVNYYMPRSCPGHVSVDLYPAGFMGANPTISQGGDYSGKPALTFPIYVANKGVLKIHTDYIESFLTAKHCCCCPGICFCLCTNNCSDGVNGVLASAGFDITKMPFCSFVSCFRSECCSMMSDYCCCGIPTCGCSTPSNTMKFARDISFNQMAADEKIHQRLVDEYKKSMKKNGWDEKRIESNIKIVENEVANRRSLMKEGKLFFKLHQIEKKSENDNPKNKMNVVQMKRIGS